MWKWLLIAVVFAVLGVLTWNAGQTKRDFEDFVKYTNERAPFEAAPGVTLDKTELNDKKLVMHMTLTDEEVDASSVDKQQTIHLLKTTLTQGWCGDAQLRGAIDDGYVITTVANLADDSELTRFDIGYEECVCASQKGDFCVIR